MATRDEVGPYVDEAIAALPMYQREAIVLRYLAGKTEAEVAEEMGCLRGKVSIVYSGVEDLLKQLDELERKRAIDQTTAMMVREMVNLPAKAGREARAEASEAAGCGSVTGDQ